MNFKPKEQKDKINANPKSSEFTLKLGQNVEKQRRRDGEDDEQAKVAKGELFSSRFYKWRKQINWSEQYGISEQ